MEKVCKLALAFVLVEIIIITLRSELQPVVLSREMLEAIK
jgi:hypothetical protein